VVALLGLVLSIAAICLMKRFGLPDKLAVAAAYGSPCCSIFWTSVMLGTDEDDD